MKKKKEKRRKKMEETRDEFGEETERDRGDTICPARRALMWYPQS